VIITQKRHHTVRPIHWDYQCCRYFICWPHDAVDVSLCMCQAVRLDAHATQTSRAQEMFWMLFSADPAISAPDQTASVRNRCVWPRCYLLYLPEKSTDFNELPSPRKLCFTLSVFVCLPVHLFLCLFVASRNLKFG